MTKLVKILLWSLILFSICMLLFRWGIIPPIFEETKNAVGKNEVMFNLSYSYLAGYIFYLKVTLLPYKMRARKMKPFIDDKKAVICGKIKYCGAGD